jgi:hypothetical protein
VNEPLPFGHNAALERLARQHAPASTEGKTAKLELGDAVLCFNGEPAPRNRWPILDAIIEAIAELTVTGASTLELVCEDPEFSLLNDEWFKEWMLRPVGASTEKKPTLKTEVRENVEAVLGEEDQEVRWELPEKPIDLNVDGIWFRLAGFKVNEDKLTLLWEDLLAAILRYEVGLVHKRRSGSMTRAKFIHELFQKAVSKHHPPGVCAFWAPEEGIRQKVEGENEEETTGKGGENPSASEEAETTESALTNTDGITVKGKAASEAQLKVLNEALAAAHTLTSSPFKARVALVEALIQESDCENLTTGTGESKGALQVEAATAAGIESKTGEGHLNPENVGECAEHFLTAGFADPGSGGANALAKAEPNLTAAEIAQKVQGSRAGAASKGEATYGQWKSEAEKIVNTYAGLKGGTTNTASNTSPFEFTCGKNQTYWDCIQALAQEVNWYAFIRENCLFYVSGEFLYAQATRMHVERGKLGVDWVNPCVELGARDSIAEIEVMARSSSWTALAGTLVRVAQIGPVNGKWLVNSITMDLLDPSKAITVKLQKPLPPKKEKAHGESSSKEKGAKGTALAAFNAASKLSEMELPYPPGDAPPNGHGPGALAHVSKESPEPLDCSSSTSWILHEAGMFPSTTAWVSGEFAEKWGDPGEGQEMTVWANAAHVFIEFKIPGHNVAQANTNGPEDGSRLYTLSEQRTYNVDPKAEGYTARHFPGT